MIQFMVADWFEIVDSSHSIGLMEIDNLVGKTRIVLVACRKAGLNTDLFTVAAWIGCRVPHIVGFPFSQTARQRDYLSANPPSAAQRG